MDVRTIEDTEENKVGNQRTKKKQRNSKILHRHSGNIRIQSKKQITDARKPKILHRHSGNIRIQSKKQITDARKPKIQTSNKRNPEIQNSLSRKRGPSRGISGSKKRHHIEHFLLVEINRKFGLKVTTFSELLPKPQPIKTIQKTTHAKAVQYNPKTRRLFYFCGIRLITFDLNSNEQKRLLTLGRREEVYILRIDFNSHVTFMTTSYHLIISKIFIGKQKHAIRRIFEMEITPDERLASICMLHNNPLKATYGTVDYDGALITIHTVKGAPCGPTFILEGHFHIVGDVLLRYDIHKFKQVRSPCLKLEETSKYFILNDLIYSIDSKKGKIEKRDCMATTTIYNNLESTNSHSNWYLSNYIR